jgi:hypothetical protein
MPPIEDREQVRSRGRLGRGRETSHQTRRRGRYEAEQDRRRDHQSHTDAVGVGPRREHEDGRRRRDAGCDPTPAFDGRETAREHQTPDDHPEERQPGSDLVQDAVPADLLRRSGRCAWWEAGTRSVVKTPARSA